MKLRKCAGYVIPTADATEAADEIELLRDLATILESSRDWWKRRALAGASEPPSAVQFSLEQLDFIALEMYASLSCGADHPLFQSTYDRARELQRHTPTKTEDQP